jgi:hypothetical protein
MFLGRVKPAMVAASLIAVFTLQSFLASLGKSPTSDEPAHIAAGLSYLQTRIFHINLQHPPLLKELAAAALLAAGVRYPATAEAAETVNAPPNNSGREWQVGYHIIGTNPDRVLFWARLPMILIGALFGVALWLLGRKLVGDAAALGALFLYALDPTLIAHSYLVTTDVGVGAFILLFLYTLWLYLEQPGTGRMVWCGVAMGGMLGAKYSAVAVVPVAAILLAAACVHFQRVAPTRKGKAAASPRKLTVDTAAIYRFATGFGGMVAIAVFVVWALFLFHSPLLYLEGMQRVNADHNPDFLAYMAGDLKSSFSTYFLVCYLLKEPLASILLAAAGLWLLVRSGKIGGLQKLFVLLPPAVLVAGYVWKADDLGIRYIIPALPFVWLAGGLALARLLGAASRSARIAGVVACAWLVVAAAGIYPDHLSYFNESACLLDNPAKVGLDGGSRCGVSWLADSNVDWGQGLKQLKTWLDSHAGKRQVYLACFGCQTPEDYGIHAATPDLQDPPKPGLYAISGHFDATLPAVGRVEHTTLGYWLPVVRPIAIVGHAFYIYDVPAGGLNGIQ